MKKTSVIRIYQFQNDTSTKLIAKLCSIEPHNKIFKDINSIIKRYMYNIDDMISEITNSFDNTTDESSIDYMHDIYIYDKFGYITYIIMNKHDVLIDYKKIIINRNSGGNCIDDFIDRGVYPIIESIERFCNDINRRIDKRTNNNEYHQTSCYEYDFRQIVNIKQLAEKLIRNCDKQLEAISEKYTKI